MSTGDVMVLMKAVGAAEYAGSKGKLLSFCEENGLRHKAVVEIRKLRQQLTNEINLNMPDLNLMIDPRYVSTWWTHMSRCVTNSFLQQKFTHRMPPPTDTEAKLLRQIVLAGMADQIARKVAPDDVKEDQDKSKWKYAYRCPYIVDYFQ